MGVSCYSDTNKKNNNEFFIKEINVDGPTRIPLERCTEASKGVCKISYSTIEGNNYTASGFFLTNDNNNKYLLTNNHVLTEEMVNSNKEITIEIYNKNTYKLKLKQKNIKLYEDPLDIAIIQINDLNELCNNIKFLSIDLNYKKGYNIYLNKEIYILGYPLGNSVEYSPGKTKKINPEGELGYDCNTDSGSSGSPIFLKDLDLVIGIHKAGEIRNKINIGTFIGKIMEKLNNNNNYTEKNLEKSTKIKFKADKERVTKSSNMSKNINKKTTNFIIAEYLINLDDINNKVRIINSYEAYERNLKNFEFEEDLRNENDIKKCSIEIEGKPIKFRYYHIFNEEGIFKIKFTFNKILNNLMFIFSNCPNLTKIDLSNFNSQNITNMSYIFFGCSSLTSVNLSNFNTYKANDMSYMFSGCSSLINLDLSDFNTKQVSNMNYMFFGCSSLTNLDLSNFNTKNVTNMINMFYNCSSLSNLDLSNFNSKNVINMNYMFRGCKNLTKSNIKCYDDNILKNLII